MSIPIIRAQKCSACKFMEKNPAGVMFCYFNPPITQLWSTEAMGAPKREATLQQILVYPQVFDDSWCHQYRPKIQT
jgi:hypothetical protein